jgi:hypothetical protein
MIVVSVEVWPDGSKEARRVIQVASIWHVSGDHDESDYSYALSKPAVRGTSCTADPKGLVRGEGVWKSGSILAHVFGHGALRLVQKCFEAALRGEP